MTQEFNLKAYKTYTDVEFVCYTWTSRRDILESLACGYLTSTKYQGQFLKTLVVQILSYIRRFLCSTVCSKRLLDLPSQTLCRVRRFVAIVNVGSPALAPPIAAAASPSLFEKICSISYCVTILRHTESHRLAIRTSLHLWASTWQFIHVYACGFPGSPGGRTIMYVIST